VKTEKQSVLQLSMSRRPKTTCSEKRRLFLVGPLRYISPGSIPKVSIENVENNTLNKIFTVNKVMSFSRLFLLMILNVTQGHNSKVRFSKNNSVQGAHDREVVRMCSN
jgi:hypothetical protein